uniref:Uncharacterized protein n=1 Tax=Arundo donax TaxID=35708 RepID=A0A0A9BRS9_ARUDO
MKVYNDKLIEKILFAGGICIL